MIYKHKFYSAFLSMVSLENGNYQLELIAWWISFAVLKFVLLEAKPCVNEKRIFTVFGAKSETAVVDKIA